MSRELNALWESSPPASERFEPEAYLKLPSSAWSYLTHAIAPGTPLASAVLLHMHGELKLRDTWLPFVAEQAIHRSRGFLWEATARKGGVPLVGAESLLDGAGEIHWKLWGLFSIKSATGPHVTRSAIGRFLMERLWLPSALCDTSVDWTDAGATHAFARQTVEAERSDLALGLDDSGRLCSASLSRWGSPKGAAFLYVPFGGHFDEERTFGGYTIPTRVRFGWRPAADRFEGAGEFFRATIDAADFR